MGGDISNGSKPILRAAFFAATSVCCGALGVLAGGFVGTNPGLAIPAVLATILQKVFAKRASERMHSASASFDVKAMANHDLHRVAGQVVLYALYEMHKRHWLEATL